MLKRKKIYTNFYSNVASTKTFLAPLVMHKRSKGHTLLELVVVIFLIALVSLAIVALINFGLVSYKSVDKKIEQQQKLLKVFTSLEQDLSKTAFDSITIVYPSGSPSQGDLAISFLTPDGEKGEYHGDADGTPIYQAYLIYFIRTSDKTLRKKRVSLATPTTTPTPLPSDSVIAHIQAGSSVLLLRDVKSFKALSCGTHNVISVPENPFVLEIILNLAGRTSLIQRKVFKIPR